MARALAAVGAALVFLLLVLGVVVYVNRDEDAIAVDNLLAENLTREIATAAQRGDDVDLADVTDFKWDHVLVAEHSASRGVISKALGAPWKGDVAFGTGDVLIFIRRGHVARYADYRGEGRFDGVPRPVARFARADALFTVRDLVIRPKRPPATSSP
jgi:hypothetical protein